MNKIIAVDFDGTLFETEYPTILRPILPVLHLARERKARGDKLILWTCREGKELDGAVEMCRNYGLEFDAVNDNLPEMKEKWGNNPRKVAADEYWDDRNGEVFADTSQWVSVHERLPEKYDYGKYGDQHCAEFLVVRDWDFGKLFPAIRTIEVARYGMMEYPQKTEKCFYEDHGFGEMENVAYWRELPEIPKEEENDA